MGPSILAAAFTTIAAAVIMLFTVITFFQKFATILCYTVSMATVGALVVFLTLADTFGPSEPTVAVDSLVKWVKNAVLCSQQRGELPLTTTATQVKAIDVVESL